MTENLPTLIYAVKKIGYTATSLVDLDNDDDVTLQDMVEMALDYASEDINDSTVSHYLIAEYHDESGKTIKTEEYDWEGNLLSSAEKGKPTMITTKTESEIYIELGSGYDDPEVEYAYICSVADNIKTTHVVAVNGENRPLFKVVDDEGIIIEPGYKTVDLAVLAAKAWLS
jgi:hypothetical protein